MNQPCNPHSQVQHTDHAGKFFIFCHLPGRVAQSVTCLAESFKKGCCQLQAKVCARYFFACLRPCREPDKTSRDKTSHAILLHPGQNIPQRFATPDKTSHAVFVTPDITSHATFVTPDITSHAIFATPDKTDP